MLAGRATARPRANVRLGLDIFRVVARRGIASAGLHRLVRIDRYVLALRRPHCGPGQFVGR